MQLLGSTGFETNAPELLKHTHQTVI